MARRTIDIGSLIGAYVYDDSTGDVSLNTDGPIRTTNTPVNPADALRLNDVGGGGPVAPSDAQFLVLTLDGDLSDERVLTAGDGLEITDGGANNPATIDAIETKRYALLVS